MQGKGGRWRKGRSLEERAVAGGKGGSLEERAGRWRKGLVLKGAGRLFHRQLPLSSSNRPFPATTLSFLSSRAQPRDLQFRGPFLEMFLSGATLGNKGVAGKEIAGQTLCVLADADSRGNEDISGHEAIVPNLQIGFR